MKEQPIVSKKGKPPKHLATERAYRRRLKNRQEQKVQARIEEAVKAAKQEVREQLAGKYPYKSKIPIELIHKLPYWHDEQGMSLQKIADLLLSAYGIRVSKTTIKYQLDKEKRLIEGRKLIND